MFGNSALILKLAWANWQHMNARRIAWQARLLSATALRPRRSQIWSTGWGSGCLLCWIYQRKHRYAAWNITFWQFLISAVETNRLVRIGFAQKGFLTIKPAKKIMSQQNYLNQKYIFVYLCNLNTYFILLSFSIMNFSKSMRECVRSLLFIINRSYWFVWNLIFKQLDEWSNTFASCNIMTKSLKFETYSTPKGFKWKLYSYKQMKCILECYPFDSSTAHRPSKV